jgi:hypothetical protein
MKSLDKWLEVYLLFIFVPGEVRQKLPEIVAL